MVLKRDLFPGESTNLYFIGYWSLVGGAQTLDKSGEDGKTTLETSGEDGKTTLETSGEDGKTTLETGVEDRTRDSIFTMLVG